MSDISNGPGWWLANDGRWYPPEARPGTPPMQVPVAESMASEPFPAGLPSAWIAPTQPVPSPVNPYPQQLATSVQPQSVGLVAPLNPQLSPPAVFSPSHSKRRRRYPLVLAWVLAGVFFLSTVGLAIFSYHQTSSANQWRSADEKAVAELATAHASIKSLNSQVSSLNGQVTSLNTQLAAQANAKEKALDQNTVLGQLVGAEGTVSTELNTCVTDLQTLVNTVATDLGSGYYSDPSLSAESDTASTDCTQAQSDNQTLQSDINGATG